MSHDQPESVPVYTIGKVEELTGLSARQIRYYEDRGLVSPSRSEGNQRLYTPDQVELLKQIRVHLQQGLNLAGIRRLLEESGLLARAARQATPTSSDTGDDAEEQRDSAEEGSDDPDAPGPEDYPARHLLWRGHGRSLYPLRHPHELLERITRDSEGDKENQT